MGLKKWFKDKPSEPEAPPQTIGLSVVHQLALRLRGAYDLDEILQLVANALGEQLKVDYCLVYLCDPSVDTLRWRAGYEGAGLAPWRWPLKESDFPELFARLRIPEIVPINDPLRDPLVASGRSRFESAGVRSLVFVPAFSEQLEAVIVLGQVSQPRRWSDEELYFLETVAAEVAVAARHITLSSALRRAGSQVYNVTAELEAENQHLQRLIQLLLLPPADLTQVLNHISESLADLYHVKVCSIEEVQGEITAVRSLWLAGRTTNLGVFQIAGTPRQQVVETRQHRICFNAIEAYPEDWFLKEHKLDFYAGVPILNRAGELIGLLNLYHQETVNLPKRDLRVLQGVARRIGFELEDERAARARAEAEHEIAWRLEAVAQWEEQMKFLREARELLRQTDSLESGLQELVISANKHMGSDFAAIALYDLVASRSPLVASEKTVARRWSLVAGEKVADRGSSVADRESFIQNPQSKIQNPATSDQLDQPPATSDQRLIKQLITAGIEPAVRDAIGGLPTGRGLLGLLAEWDGPMRLDNVAHHPQFTGFPATHPVMRSFLAVPLRVRGETVGAIYFADKNGGEPFSNEDESFATELAAQIALAVAAPVVVAREKTVASRWSLVAGEKFEDRESFTQNPKSKIQNPATSDQFDAQRQPQSEHESRLMRTVIESISQPSLSADRQANLEHICDEILGNLAETLGVSHGALFLYHADEREFVLFRQRGVDEILASLAERLPLEKAEDSLSGLATGEPLIISEIETDPHIRSKDLVDVLRAEGLRSGMVALLQDSNNLLGLLALGSQEPNHFTHYSREFFSILAHRIASLVARRWSLVAGEKTGDRESFIQNPKSKIQNPATSDQWMETLLENLSSGVVAIDGDGRITVFNPAMERLTGYRRHEMLGQPISDCGLRIADWEMAELFNPKSDIRHPKSVETHVLTRGGGKKYVSLTITPLTDEQGTLAGAVGLFTDITQIRALEHERYRLTPLALIGEMSARLAHEIKNPLASMMSGLELLKRRLQYDEREGQYFERLIAELQRLDSTVREMLAYSRTTPPRLAPADPADPLERALDILMPQLQAGRVEVVRDYQVGMEPALMDANLMEQVFLNLIINAIDAMPDGGTLNCRLRIADCGLGEEQPTRKDDQSEIRNPKSEIIEYTVSDTGVGIPPDVIGKIFDPFFSTKPHGTGLGLVSVQKIIEAHQGQISVESEPGQGTTFTIRLQQQSPVAGR